MNTGALNSKSLKAITQALRAHLPVKETPSESPASSASSRDESALRSQEPRYRAWENAQPPDHSSYGSNSTPASDRIQSVGTGTSWLSGRTLQNILAAVKRHLGGTIPPGTVITIRPRPGGHPGQFTVTVNTRAGTAPRPAPATPPTKPSEGGSPVQGGGAPAAPGDLRSLLSAPLPALPGPAQGSDASQNDLRNRSELIKGIRQDPGLQTALANWDRLPQDLRLQAGQRISDMMGKIYGFEASRVEIDPSLRAPTLGYFNPGSNQLCVSSDILRDPKTFVNTVTHEQAHSYQHQKANDAMSGRLPASDPLYATARTWGQNFANYRDPNVHGYAAYRNQPIEAHAFATGTAVSAGVFN